MPDLEETLIARWFVEAPCEKEVERAVSGMLVLLVLCLLSPLSTTAVQILSVLHLDFSMRFPLNKEFGG